MLFGKRIGFIVIATTIAGCSAQGVSRNATDYSLGSAPVYAQSSVATDPASISREADQLVEKTSEMVRSATLKGAGLGAALGCGLSTLSGSTNCIQAAVVGGAVGGVIGHARGKAAVEKRIEIVAPKALMPKLSEAKKTSAALQSSLAALLAQQETERAELAQALKNKGISQEAYNARHVEMRETRLRLYDALTLSANQIKEVSRALSGATEQGQAGLQWYEMETQALHDLVISTRSQITLL